MNSGVVLLFGTFNPFTNAHLNIAYLAKKAFPEYKVCFVPAKAGFMTGYKGLDDTNVISEDMRLDLIKGSIESIPDFMVTDVEFGSKVDGKTVNTIEYFKSVLGFNDVVLCFGTDKVAELETWYKGYELVKDNKFLIVTRDDTRLESVMTEYTSKYRDNFTEIINSDLATLSGTEVRQAIKEGNWDFIKSAVPEYVYREIRDYSAKDK